MEVIVGIAVVVVVVLVASTLIRSGKSKANRATVIKKMEELGSAFQQYTSDNDDLLPLEDAPGKDHWLTAKDEAAAEVWYNALPEKMGSIAVGKLSEPARFYDLNYPLFMPGVPYPKGEKRLKRPIFAVAMSSRLQRKGENEVKARGTLASILQQDRTVLFLERGISKKEKTWAGQQGFDGSPKANPSNFVGRHQGKGVLLFVDGHTELKLPSDVVTKAGLAPEPQEDIVWTPDPDDDPN